MHISWNIKWEKYHNRYLVIRLMLGN
jgi:hypothetical protein